MVESATASSTSPPKRCTLESASVSSRYSLLTTLTATTPLSSCTAENCSPDATLPTAAHHARHRHPSQRLYCGELLPDFATLPAAAILAAAATLAIHSGCTAVNLISSLQFGQMSSTPAQPGPPHLTPNLGTQSSSPPPASHTQYSTFSEFLAAVTGQETTPQDDQHPSGQ